MTVMSRLLTLVGGECLYGRAYYEEEDFYEVAHQGTFRYAGKLGH